MRETIQLFRPSVTEEEIQAVNQVLRSGWLGLGPRTTEFEKAFGKYIGSSYVVGTNSCTASLDLAIRQLRLSPDDEVIVPTVTFISTAHAVVYNHCRPVFADVDPVTLNICLKDLEKKITSKTRAIMVVHYGGRPADMDAIKAIAKDIPLIEDCAHASGARYKGQHVGTLGTSGCFSFQAVKNLSMGDGGAICVKNEDDFMRLKRLRWLGIDKGTWDRTDKNKDYWWEYGVDEIGLKCHMNDILAAMGLVQLKRLDEMNAKRKQNVETYRRAFKGLDWLVMPPEDDKVYQSSWHICSIQLNGADRNDFSQYLKDKGIVTGVHYKPIHLYRCYGYQPHLPQAETVFPKILSLPNHPELSPDDLAYIIDAIQAYKAKPAACR